MSVLWRGKREQVGSLPSRSKAGMKVEELNAENDG